jgi:4-hydroxybenzoate polyprenyltransferase
MPVTTRRAASAQSTPVKTSNSSSSGNGPAEISNGAGKDKPDFKPGPVSQPAVSTLSVIIQLARLKMAVFSAVTYSAAFTLGRQLAGTFGSFNYTTFILGWLFMFLCQLSAHLLGEYYDLPSDKLNKGGPFTGGSRVLVAGKGDPRIALKWGWVATFCAAAVLGGYPRFDSC